MRGKPPSRPASLGPRPRRTSRSWNWKNPSPARNPSTRAYRARFAELHEERERLEAQLRALAKTTRAAADTSRDRLPLAREVLPRPSPRVKAWLFQAFDVSILPNKPGRQATLNADITEATLRAAAILDPSKTAPSDTRSDQPEPLRHLGNVPRRFIRTSHSLIFCALECQPRPGSAWGECAAAGW